MTAKSDYPDHKPNKKKKTGNCSIVSARRIVGSKGFVEHVKSALGALAKGRKAKDSGDSYQLREPSAPSSR